MEELKDQGEKTQISIEDISIFPTETLNSLSPGGRKQVESTLKHAGRIIAFADKFLSLGERVTTWEHKPGEGYHKNVCAEKKFGKFQQSLSINIGLDDNKELHRIEVAVNDKGNIYRSSVLLWMRVLDGGLSFFEGSTPLIISGPFFRIPEVIPFNPSGYSIPASNEEDIKVCDLVLEKIEKFAGKMMKGKGISISSKSS